MKRKAIKNVAKDKKIFAKTEKKTKTINVRPVVQRGGTRL